MLFSFYIIPFMLFSERTLIIYWYLDLSLHSELQYIREFWNKVFNKVNGCIFCWWTQSPMIPYSVLTLYKQWILHEDSCNELILRISVHFYAMDDDAYLKMKKTRFPNNKSSIDIKR